MGYVNKTFRTVVYSPEGRRRAKRIVTRLRRRAEKRELNGEHLGKQAERATRRGWWFD